MPHVIVSYDGTRNDRDALALGRLFAAAGAQVSLAYVRHASEQDRTAEVAAQAEAERLLASGAALLDGADVGEYVIIDPSTADGLATLAAELGADVVAFGSSPHTPPGHVGLPQTAEQLLERGPSFSLALAPAGLRREPVERSIGTIGVFDADADDAARATAQSLALALGAMVTSDDADLVVVASRPEASGGRLLLSAVALEQIGEAGCPVLALARGVALVFV